MLHDELYQMTDQKMLSKLGSYADSVLYQLERYQLNKKLGDEKNANESFKIAIRDLEFLRFCADFQVEVNDVLADGGELDETGQELKNLWDNHEI